MSNQLLKLLSLIKTFTGDDYSYDITDEDLLYFNNTKVQDVIFETYMDILKLQTIKDEEQQDTFLNIIALLYRLRLFSLTEEEQNYVNKRIASVIMSKDDEKDYKRERKINYE